MSDSKPSRYVDLYIPRKQAEEIHRLLIWHATGQAKSHIAWAALRNVEKALEGDGS